MNIDTLLSHTSPAIKEQLLKDIIAYGFTRGAGDGEIRFDCDRQGIDAFIAEKLRKHIDTTTGVVAAVEGFEEPDDDEEGLDGIVYDAFSFEAEKVNGEGFTGQVRSLIVDLGWSVAQIEAAIAEG